MNEIKTIDGGKWWKKDVLLGRANIKKLVEVSIKFTLQMPFLSSLSAQSKFTILVKYPSKQRVQNIPKVHPSPCERFASVNKLQLHIILVYKSLWTVKP